jgi:hypothetical protein
VDADGISWVSDAPYVLSGGSVNPSDLRDVSITYPEYGLDSDLVKYSSVFETERFVTNGGTTLDYSFPVRPGQKYRVRFLFVESWHDIPGTRIFDIEIGGHTVVDNLDVMQHWGFQRALSITPTGVIADGSTLSVVLRSSGSTAGPAVYGIVLEEAIFA